MGLRRIVELTKEELLDLAEQYSLYVTDFYETHDEGSRPVCLEEFYDNDYKTPKERTAELIYETVKTGIENDLPEEDIIESIGWML